MKFSDGLAEQAQQFADQYNGGNLSAYVEAAVRQQVIRHAGEEYKKRRRSNPDLARDVEAAQDFATDNTAAARRQVAEASAPEGVA